MTRRGRGEDPAAAPGAIARARAVAGARDRAGAGAMADQSLDSLDLLIRIFYHLSPLDIATSSLTCKFWHRAASDQALWRHLCLQTWPSLHDSSLSSAIRSFSTFFSQRASNSVDLQAVQWLQTDLVTFFLDVSFRNQPFFSKAICGSAVVKDHLRFKLPPIAREEALIGVRKDGASMWAPFRDLHVQLSVVRQRDGQSACLVNGFPAEKDKENLSGYAHGRSRKGLRCVLMLLDNHAFLNFLW